MTVHDLAAYILGRTGAVSAMKLQKLVYYSQAWSLVWDDRPLFDDKIQAWRGGPVVPALFRKHKGIFMVSEWPEGDASKLDDRAKTTVNKVVKFYGKLDASQLSALTHREKPWVAARQGLGDDDASGREITLESMLEFYSSLK